MLWYSFPCKTHFFNLSFCLLLCASSLSLHLISIERYKWPLDRTFYFHNIDLHCTVGIIQTLIILRCIYDVLKKVSHISLFFFLFLYLFRCVCNIDCSQTNFNPLCASDGKSYDNACQIKEASCQKQEKIEVMSLGRCQGNSHNKTHFKECFQFLCREGKKKKTNQGWLLLWELLRFHYAAAVYTVEHRLWEVRGRALCDADAVRWEGGSTPNPAQSSSRGCPALHWALHQSPLPCPQQLAQSSVCQEQKEQGSGNAPQIDFATQGGCSGAALSGAAWGSLGRFSKEVLPNTGLGLVLQVTLPGPIDAQEAWKEVFQWWLEALYFSINTMLLCAHLLGYYITHNPWADFKNPIFL